MFSNAGKNLSGPYFNDTGLIIHCRIIVNFCLYFGCHHKKKIIALKFYKKRETKNSYVALFLSLQHTYMFTSDKKERVNYAGGAVAAEGWGRLSGSRPRLLALHCLT